MKRYWVEERGIKAAIEDAKQRLTATSHRLERYTARIEQYRINRMFATQPGRVFSELRNETNTSEIPDKEQTYNFWKGVWGRTHNHNEDVTWEQPCEVPL